MFHLYPGIGKCISRGRGFLLIPICLITACFVALGVTNAHAGRFMSDSEALVSKMLN